jgi:putative glycerol-1-phosphate prenyltransferase
MIPTPEYDRLVQLRAQGQKALAVLIDPDKGADAATLVPRLRAAEAAGAGFLFIGGSLLHNGHTAEVVRLAQQHTRLPVWLFPGTPQQLCPEADAVLFLSLISGRNADLLIGQHVHAAPVIRQLELEPIATGYMLVDCGRATTASYISGTQPLPNHKPDIAAATALAGQYLGLRTLYLDGGSGAPKPIHPHLIAAVRAVTDIPLIVGGGIRTPQQAHAAWHAGADVLVVGTAAEDEADAHALLAELLAVRV